jgi:hypothetical protein
MRYYADDIHYSTAPQNSDGESIARSSLTDSGLFFKPLLDYGMNWDSNETWKWDTIKHRPMFQWE